VIVADCPELSILADPLANVLKVILLLEGTLG
jgi:hypothetical protein